MSSFASGGERKVANRSPISHINVICGGSNYTTAEVKITSSLSTDAKGAAVAIIENGSVTKIDLTNCGNYGKNPKITISGDGSGARAVSILQNLFDIGIEIQVEKSTVNSKSQTILGNAKISTTYNGPVVGVNAYFLFDISGSMNNHCQSTGKSRLETMKSGARQFISTLGPQDVICLTTFHSVGEEVFPPQFCTPGNVNKALECLNRISTRGATNFVGGLDVVFSSKRSCTLGSSNKNVCVLITDGDFTGEQKSNDGQFTLGNPTSHVSLRNGNRSGYGNYQAMVQNLSDFVENHARCNGGTDESHKMSLYCIDVGGTTNLTQRFSEVSGGKSIGGSAEGLMNQISLIGRTIKSSLSSLGSVRFELRSKAGEATFLDDSTVDFCDNLSDGSVVHRPFKFKIQAGGIKPEIEFRLKAQMMADGKFSDILRSKSRVLLRSMIGLEFTTKDKPDIVAKHAESNLAKNLAIAQKEAESGNLNAALERVNLARQATQATYRSASVPSSAWVSQIGGNLDRAMNGDTNTIIRAIRGVSGIARSDLLRTASQPCESSGGTKSQAMDSSSDDEDDFDFTTAAMLYGSKGALDLQLKRS